MATHPLWRTYAPEANADRQDQRVAQRQVDPGPLQEHQACWDSRYAALRGTIEAAVPDQVLWISHIGSTAIPGLIAKPVIDIDLTVPDVDDEVSYVPRLEAVGFRLIFRDDFGGDAHRQLAFALPNANLHVWNPGAIEPQRHQLFKRWLQTCPEDLELYAAAKLDAIGSVGVGRYNDLKSAVVYDIYEHAFLADPSHGHDPQPRGNA